MNINDWQYLNKEISYYLEYFILPNILAFSIAKMYYNNMPIIEDYDTYYNTFKNLVNIMNENKKLIKNICFNILKSKYYLKVISTKPLKVEKIN